MAREQCSDPGTLIAGGNLAGAKKGSLLKLSSGKAALTTAATDVVVAVLRTDLDSGRDTTDKAVPVWPINKAFQVPVLMGAAAAADRLLVPDGAAGKNGKAATVADIAGLAANQVAFGQVIEAASAEDEVVTALAQVIAGPTA